MSMTMVENDNMANSQVVPNKTQLRVYLSQGLTQQQIVDAWKRDCGVTVSRSAIAMAIERYGLKSAHSRPRYEDLLPWRVANEHREKTDARMLRAEGRRRAGQRLTAQQERRLDNWLADLAEQDAVVHYDRETEQGFFWIPRSEANRGSDDIINKPKSPSIGELIEQRNEEIVKAAVEERTRASSPKTPMKKD